ncbi:hypothetical protein F2Q68_00045861 [Brassica cretica]|uniref:Uncharacterized protein n=1 Tax=Brassica cretica TaxID=69181 RepID=A0A8S9LU16_BRACR|nr:hypothetical protein F2Q68_00045861 [Brassica cretica]
MEFEMVELCRRRHGKGLDSVALPSIPSQSSPPPLWSPLSLSLSLSLSVLIMFFFVGRAGGREQRRQYGGTQDWYVSGQDLRWLHLLTTTTAATSVKRDAAVVQAGGGVVVVRWRCGRD